MKTSVVCMLCLFFCIFIGTPFAAEMTRLGPKQYIRTSGSPDIFTDSFTAIPGEGMLIVKNGAIDGSDRITDAISSASIFLNGVKILGTNDFNQNVYLLQAPVDLGENNSITVELGSSPRSFLTIEVTQGQQQEKPAVTFTADPENIPPGGLSTLTWSSANADTCVIEPEIGPVERSGSMDVSPPETITYTITATGPGGTETASVSVVVTPLAVSFISPLDGDTLSRPDIMVHGTITNPLGNEVGVRVNGILAVVYGNQFVANHVPLEHGENTITAIVTDVDGNTATASIAVNAVTAGNYIRIAADTESGVSPFETTLEVEGPFTFPESSISHTGPGTVEFLDSTSQEYRVKISGEGIYYFTANVTDDQSTNFTDTFGIVVLDKAFLDTLLRTKWEGMRNALAIGDIPGAVKFFDDSRKNVYRDIFSALSEQQRIQMAQEFEDIQFINKRKNSAEYDLRIMRGAKEYSFFLLFIKNSEGLWKIRSF